MNNTGVEICLELARAGMDIFFTYSDKNAQIISCETNENEPVILEKKIKKFGVKCSKYETDFSSSESGPLLLSSVMDSMGIPHILVNVGAFPLASSYYSLEPALLDEYYMMNIRTAILLSINFARIADGKTGGRIINITSGQLLSEEQIDLPYVTTKGAIDAFTLNFAKELSEKGININAINISPRARETYFRGSKKEGRLKRNLPKDIARMVHFLTAKETEWVTGQIIQADIGFLQTP